MTTPARGGGMASRAFWVDVAERAVKTFAQTLIPLLAADGTNLLNLDWPAALAVAGTATVLSVLTSIGSAGISGAGTASLVDTIIDPDTGPGRHTRRG